MTQFIPTAKKVEVPDYPYGYKLRCTLYDWMEYKPKHGYRHVTQTVNPKNGRLNKPKAGQYYPLLVRYYNEEGHIKTMGFGFNGDEDINKACAQLARPELFGIFTKDEVKHLYELSYAAGLADMKATSIYGGSKPEDLKPLYQEYFKNAKHGIDTGENVFHLMKLDSEAIDATKPADYNPFTTVSHRL